MCKHKVQSFREIGFMFVRWVGDLSIYTRSGNVHKGVDVSLQPSEPNSPFNDVLCSSFVWSVQNAQGKDRLLLPHLCWKVSTSFVAAE